MPTEHDFATQFVHPELLEEQPRKYTRLTPPPPPREQVLSGVSHPRLRELVETAYKLARKHGNVPWLRTDFDYLDKVRKRGADAYDYRMWVWRRLHDSDLAQQLPGGKSHLPDILDAMREPWRTLEKQREPKNYAQLLKHVTRYLDWYLEPSKPVKPPVRQIALWVGIALLPLMIYLSPKLLWLLWLLFKALGVDLPSNDHGLNGALVYVWGISVAIVNAVAYRFGSHTINGRKLHRFHNAKQRIDAAELYYYLAFAYADRPDPDAPAQL